MQMHSINTKILNAVRFELDIHILYRRLSLAHHPDLRSHNFSQALGVQMCTRNTKSMQYFDWLKSEFEYENRTSNVYDHM